VSGQVFALANQKGGVGKTTTAVNLAACLAEAGERTLVVDLDPQANATSGLGERANGASSVDLLDGADLPAGEQAASKLATAVEESPPGFILLRKTGPTPEGFPRRPGVAKKRPLA